MKKEFKTMAILMLMGLAATGCQKENMVEPQSSVAAECSQTTVCYNIDGVTYQASFDNEESWKDFLHWLFALAEEGHRVSFRNANQERGITKETVTHVTFDHDEALAWADNMRKRGYEVTVTFDENTKEYTCVAIR